MSKKKQELYFFSDEIGRQVTFTPKALEVLGTDMQAFVDIVKERSEDWERVSIVLPSTIAIDPGLLKSIKNLEAVRVYNHNDEELHFTRPLADDEVLKNGKDEPIFFSGYSKPNDVIVEPKRDRIPFTDTVGSVEIRDTDVRRQYPAKKGEKPEASKSPTRDSYYEEFGQNWLNDSTTVLVDNFRVEGGRVDVSSYIDKLEDEQLYRLTRDIKTQLCPQGIGITFTKNTTADECREYIAKVLGDDENGKKRSGEYILKHMYLDSFLNGDNLGLVKEDHDRRTVTLERDVVTFRTLDEALQRNLDGPGYMKDNINITSSSGEPQKVYLDMFEKQKWTERNSDGKMPDNRLIVRSVEMNVDYELVLGDRQRQEVEKTLDKMSAELPRGEELSKEKVEAVRNLKNADLLHGLESLKTVRMDTEKVPENMFRENECITDLYLGDRVREIGDFAGKNSLIERVHGGEHIKDYGRMCFAQTILDDDDPLDFDPKDGNLKRYTERPYRSDTKKSGRLNGTQKRRFEGLTMVSGKTFLNAKVGDGAFMNSDLSIVHHKHINKGMRDETPSEVRPTTNVVTFGHDAQGVGKMAMWNTAVEGVCAPDGNEHLVVEEYGFGLTKHLRHMSFSGSGVVVKDGGFFGSGSGAISNPHGLRMEGHDELLLCKGMKCGERAFAWSMIKKLGIGASCVGGIARSAFAGCFMASQITVLESVLQIYTAPFQLAGIIGVALYRHSLKPYVDRALTRWLKSDPNSFHATVDELGRDIDNGVESDGPDAEGETPEEKKQELRDEVKLIEERVTKGNELEVRKDKVSTETKKDLPDLGDKDVERVDGDVGRFAWLLFMKLYAKAMQRGLTVDAYLDDLDRRLHPEDGKGGLVETTDYTEISGEIGHDTKDPENPQRTYPEGVFEKLRFNVRDGIKKPALSLPPGTEDEAVAKCDGIETHVNSVSKDGVQPNLAVLGTISTELSEQKDLEAQNRYVVLSIGEKEMRSEMMKHTGVDIGKGDLDGKEFQAIGNSLGELVRDKYAEYMDIARNTTKEYLYRREAKDNTKSASEVYQSGVKQVFMMSMLDQIDGVAGIKTRMEHSGQNPDSILLSDGTKVDCSWHKIRGQDEYAFSVTTTRPIEKGMTKEEMLERYPFITEKSPALGRAYVYKGNEHYQALVDKHSADMPKPYYGKDIDGESSIGFKYDRKSDTYSVFAVSRTNPQRVPTTLDAEGLVDFLVANANKTVNSLSFSDVGIKPNRRWLETSDWAQSYRPEKVFEPLRQKARGIEPEKRPGKTDSFSRGL